MCCHLLLHGAALDCPQFAALDTRACAVTGSLTVAISGTPTCVSLDEDAVMVGLSTGVAVTYRVRGVSGKAALPAVHVRPTRVLRGAMMSPVETVVLDRAGDVSLVCVKGEVWMYETSRARVMHRIAMPSATVVCRAAVVVTGSHVVLCCEDSAGGASGGVAPFIATYRLDGTVVKHLTVPAPVRAAVLERRQDKWGGCLVTGDAKGVVTVYHPLRLEVRFVTFRACERVDARCTYLLARVCERSDRACVSLCCCRRRSCRFSVQRPCAAWTWARTVPTLLPAAWAASCACTRCHRGLCWQRRRAWCCRQAPAAVRRCHRRRTPTWRSETSPRTLLARRRRL
jgi:hypothetical protein